MNSLDDGTRPRFSLAALLLIVAVIAVVLALMRSEGTLAEIALVALTTLLMGFVGVGIMYGHGNFRPFCLGALPPLLLAMLYIRSELSWLLAKWLGSPYPTQKIALTDAVNEHIIFIGAAILAALLFGYLCVGFRWLIDRPRP